MKYIAGIQWQITNLEYVVDLCLVAPNFEIAKGKLKKHVETLRKFDMDIDTNQA